MSICNGCGGIVGRDCFNPRECEWITQEMNNQAYQEAERVPKLIKELENDYYNQLSLLQQIEIDEQHIQYLNSKVDKLKETLLNVVTAVERERKLSGNGKQLPVITEAYKTLKSLEK